MDKKEEVKRRELMKELSEIYNRIDNDPKVREEEEEYQKRFGTLTDKELRRTITI